jgi:hypothetical protein
MKKTKLTESQIVKAIKEAENGRSVSEISRALGAECALSIEIIRFANKL